MFQRVSLDVGIVLTVDADQQKPLEYVHVVLPFMADPTAGVKNLRDRIPPELAPLFIGRGASIQGGDDATIKFADLADVPSLTRVEVPLVDVETQKPLADVPSMTTVEVPLVDVETQKPLADVPSMTTVEVPFVDVEIQEPLEAQPVPGSQDAYSYCLKLRVPIQAGQRGYLRVRFHVEQAYRAIVWKQAGIPAAWSAKNGAVFELLVASLLEIVDQDDRRQVKGAMVPIKAMDLKMMIRASWQPRAAIPPFARSRLLEKEVWTRYLQRRIDLRNEGFIVVYEWEWRAPRGAVPPHDSISAQNPTSIFLSVGREFGLLPWANLPRLVLAFLLANVLLYGLPASGKLGLMQVLDGFVIGLQASGNWLLGGARAFFKDPFEWLERLEILTTLLGFTAVGLMVFLIRMPKKAARRLRAWERRWLGRGIR